MQITDSDFTRPKDEYSSYFGRPYNVLVVSDDQTTANMDPWLPPLHEQCALKTSALPSHFITAKK